MKYKLPRTGSAPLEFDGDKLAEVSTQNIRGNEQNRWYEITLYQTENPPEHGGRYVAHVTYRTKWEGELDNFWLQPCIDMKDVSFWLSHDVLPIPIRIGWPPRKEFEDRQKALIDDLKSQYNYAVSKVLEEFPERLEGSK